MHQKRAWSYQKNPRKHLSQESWSQSRDLNTGPPEYEAGALTTRDLIPNITTYYT
jgi:hypothetical protein